MAQWRPDQSFYPSPRMAMRAPAEGLAYLALINPQRTGTPDLRKRRLNLDTAAVIGGPLTAAAFDDTRPEPLEFLTAREGGWRDWLR